MESQHVDALAGVGAGFSPLRRGCTDCSQLKQRRLVNSWRHGSRSF